MGKTILVLGASSGIGEATAKYLSEQGNTVVLVARSTKKLEDVVSKLPTKAYWFSYDLQNLEEIESIFAYCKNAVGKLDGMVYCAGINRDQPLRTNSLRDMIEVTNVNYMAFVEAGKCFGKKKYSEDDSSIVAISSSITGTSASGMCTYSASKRALEAATFTMAKEYVKRGIRANVIAPAFVDTAMAHELDDWEKSLDERLIESQPLGLIEPVHIAYLVDFLLSDKSRYITGARIPVTAGN